MEYSETLPAYEIARWEADGNLMYGQPGALLWSGNADHAPPAVGTELYCEKIDDVLRVHGYAVTGRWLALHCRRDGESLPYHVYGIDLVDGSAVVQYVAPECADCASCNEPTDIRLLSGNNDGNALLCPCCYGPGYEPQHAQLWPDAFEILRTRRVSTVWAYSLVIEGENCDGATMVFLSEQERDDEMRKIASSWAAHDFTGTDCDDIDIEGVTFIRDTHTLKARHIGPIGGNSE